MKLAFIGFRHGHILSVYDYASNHPTLRIVGASEDHPPTRDQLQSAGKVKLTHDDYSRMLREVDCDAVAIGDYFGRRGEIAIAVLEAGKHVLSDKPICTRLSELDRIEELTRTRNLRFGCQLDLRDHGAYRTMRRLIREGQIGEVQTVTFTAQHPLMYGKRAAWYFEDGKHGGTINDIAIHAIDAIPWLTGRRITRTVAARVWPARPEVPNFESGGQLMLQLDNNGSVIGDVSYLTPDSLAYSADQYWRITVHGTQGLVEARYTAKSVQLATTADKSPRTLPADPDRPNGIVEDFLADIAGRSEEGMLTTPDVLTATRTTLLAQQAATMP